MCVCPDAVSEPWAAGTPHVRCSDAGGMRGALSAPNILAMQGCIPAAHCGFCHLECWNLSEFTMQSSAGALLCCSSSAVGVESVLVKSIARCCQLSFGT